MQKITQSSIISFHYQLVISRGQCYEKTDPERPCQIQMGKGQLPPFLEPHLLGLTEGERKEITISPQDAYGLYAPQKVITIPKKKIDQSETIKVDEYLEMEMSSGDCHKALVTKVTNEMVTLDLNHVLAGETLVFDIHILEINTSKKVKTR